MFSLLRQFLSENADRMNEQQRVEELNDFIVDGVDAQLFNVNDHQFLSVLFQEVQSSLIQRTGAAFAHEYDEESLAVSDLERAMEVLAGMNCRRVDPLHLHEQKLH